jgi:ribonuclease P protein component
VGTAVVRNRVRRRCRAALAELDPRPGTYLVGTSPAAAETSYAALRDDLAAALTEVGAL